MSGCLQDEEGREVRLGEGGFGVVFKVCAHKLLCWHCWAGASNAGVGSLRGKEGCGRCMRCCIPTNMVGAHLLQAPPTILPATTARDDACSVEKAAVGPVPVQISIAANPTVKGAPPHFTRSHSLCPRPYPRPSPTTIAA